MGGGNVCRVVRGGRCGGLSPRGRGKPLHIPEGLAKQGSIPAWAGETSRLCRAAATRAVYPRVGGGNVIAQHKEA